MKTIDTPELQKMLKTDKEFAFINVLGEEAFRKKHIPGSDNIPVSDESFTQKVEDLVDGDKSKTVVVYCANTECTASPTAARKLDEAGFEDVLDYEKGMQGWEEENLPVESGD